MSVYVVLSLPVGANTIAGALPQEAPSEAPATLDCLVVLDGDNWAGRVRQAKLLSERTRPNVVWLLGDRRLLDSLQDAGIDRDRLKLSSGDPTTREQMARVGRLSLSGCPGRRAIIASRLHMPRVAALARRLDPNVVLQPSSLDIEPPRSGPWQFVPAYSALRESQDALYEHAALAYYRWRGWIG